MVAGRRYEARSPDGNLRSQAGSDQEPSLVTSHWAHTALWTRERLSGGILEWYLEVHLNPDIYEKKKKQNLMFSCCERNSQNSDILHSHSHFIIISSFLGTLRGSQPTNLCSGTGVACHTCTYAIPSRAEGTHRPQGSVASLCYSRYWGVPSRPPILDSSLPGNCLPRFERSIISFFFSWLCICGIVSAPFFHYLHVDVLWINLVEPKSSPPLCRIPHRTWTKEIAEMKRRRDGAYSKVEKA